MDFFVDPELGKIEIKRNNRARRFIFRASLHGIVMTVPTFSENSSILDAFNRTKHKLTALKNNPKNNKLKFYNGFDEELADFRIVIKESQFGNVFSAIFQEGVLEIICPQNTEYDDIKVQNKILLYVENILKNRAKSYLPSRLQFLATKLNLKYNSCQVSYGKQRLGRCDNRRNILLSYRIMLLPGHLSDYIIFHELAHLTEMNHSERFYRLLNLYCNGNNKKFNNELKSFIYPI